MKGDICEYAENSADEILPNLWLGDYKSSLNKKFLLNNHIKFIIRLTKTKYPEYPGIRYITIRIDDNELCTNNDVDIINIFNKTSDIIKEALVNNYGILVHCKRGHHRSASVVCAFLMKYIKVDYVASIMYINNIRKCALRRDTCIGKYLYRYHLLLNNIYCNDVICSKKGRYNSCSCVSHL